MRNLGFVLIKQHPDQGWQEYISKEVELMKEILEQELPLTPDHILLQTIRKPKNCKQNLPKSVDISKFCSESVDSDDFWAEQSQCAARSD